MNTGAAVLSERLGLSDDELLTILDADPLSVMTDDLDHRPEIGILLALHPASGEFFRRGATLSRTVLAITVIAAAHSSPMRWTWERRRETWRVPHTTCSACRRWPPWPSPSC